MTIPSPSVDPEKMEAGRTLDALIAERIFGLVQCRCLRHDGHFPNTYCYAAPDSPEQGAEVREYSTDISAAFLVVEKLCPTANIDEAWFKLYSNNGKWCANFHRGAHDVFAETPALAICLAALQTVVPTGAPK